MTPAEPARYADSTGDGGRHGQGPEKRNKVAACHRAPVNPAADSNRSIRLFREPGKPAELHDGSLMITCGRLIATPMFDRQRVAPRPIKPCCSQLVRSQRCSLRKRRPKGVPRFVIIGLIRDTVPTLDSFPAVPTPPLAEKGCCASIGRYLALAN